MTKFTKYEVRVSGQDFTVEGDSVKDARGNEVSGFDRDSAQWAVVDTINISQCHYDYLGD